MAWSLSIMRVFCNVFHDWSGNVGLRPYITLPVIECIRLLVPWAFEGNFYCTSQSNDLVDWCQSWCKAKCWFGPNWSHSVWKERRDFTLGWVSLNYIKLKITIEMFCKLWKGLKMYLFSKLIIKLSCCRMGPYVVCVSIFHFTMAGGL